MFGPAPLLPPPQLAGDLVVPCSPQQRGPLFAEGFRIQTIFHCLRVAFRWRSRLFLMRCRLRRVFGLDVRAMLVALLSLG